MKWLSVKSDSDFCVTFEPKRKGQELGSAPAPAPNGELANGTVSINQLPL